MKRSPLNNAAHGGRPYGARHTPYNWKSHENACGRGYQSAEGSNYQCFPASNSGSQPHDDDFIPLNASTPMRHERYNAGNRYSSSGGRGSPGSGWYNNYRGNHHSTPRSNYSNRYPAYKHSPKQFHRHKRNGHKGAHRQMNVSAYVDMNSFLEDPWEDLVKKLDVSNDTSKSEGPESKSLSNPKLVNNDLSEESGSKFSKDMNLDDSQCSQESKNECSVDATFETDADLSQILKINSSVESEIRDICSSQNSLNESCGISDKICGAMPENSIHLNTSSTDTEQKDI